MAKTEMEKLRNIGIFAHIDAGKTTLSERILFYSGRIHRIGEVHDGTTALDYMAQERQRGITITSACTQVQWKDNYLNLIDTPGHIDFTIEVERSMRVLDGAVLVICSIGGIETQTEVIWHQMTLLEVPRIGFINKLDRTGADISRVLEDIRKSCPMESALLHYPIGSEKEFCGIIDLIHRQAVTWDIQSPSFNGSQFQTGPIPEEYKEEAEKYRKELLEILSYFDEELMNAFIEGHDIPPEKIHSIIRREVINCRFFPLLCGSALKNVGTQPVLDAIIDYLPSPPDLHFIYGKEPHTNKKIAIELEEDAPFCALAFKIVTDVHKGKLVYIRIYRGSISVGETCLNMNTGKTERVQKIYLMHANKEKQIEKAVAGAIVAVHGLNSAFTGNTLCDRKHQVILESIHLPEPVISVTIECETIDDKRKLEKILARILEEDPTLRIAYDEVNDQTILSGMGELQLEILIDRLKNDYGISVRQGTPQVNYKESISQEVTFEEDTVHAWGNKSYWGHLAVRVAPSEEDDVAIDINLPADFPGEIVRQIRDELHNYIKSGPYEGYALTRMKISIINGTYDEERSNDLIFHLLVHNLLQKAILQAKPFLLEPVMHVEITTPEEFVGTIVNDLQGPSVLIKEIKDKYIMKVIYAQAPLKRMFGYITRLRSLSQGRATFIMKYSHYAPVEPTKQ